MANRRLILAFACTVVVAGLLTLHKHPDQWNVWASQPATTATTSTTLDPTQPTITVYVFGQKQVILLPPGVPDPASVPPGEGVVNCIVPVGGSGTVPPEVVRGPEPDPRCQAVTAAQNGGELTPEQREYIDKFFADQGITTTTTRP